MAPYINLQRYSFKKHGRELKKGEKGTILVIDDDPDIVDLLSYNLERRGYEVISADSGIQGLWHLLEDRKPICILLDIMMPTPDGHEICRFLKSNQEFSRIPVIFISARGSSEDIKQGFVLGADAYLAKPFSIEALLRMVDQVTLAKK